MMERGTYPVSYEIQRPESYNRLTVAFRIILAIPQLLIVSALQTVLQICTVIAWFAILITGRYPEGLRGFCVMLYRWSENVRAYTLLLADPYPPFSGEAAYPLQLGLALPGEQNRLTVLLRIFMVIPHLVVLYFLNLVQGVITVVAWFAILFTGQYPAGIYNFSAGVSRWAARVLAYAMLFVDEYPPFSLDAEPGAGPRIAPAV